MRIRVRIDLGKPLKRKLFLQKEEGVNFCVRFCYEKLPSFCFLCGIIVHAESHCPRKKRGHELTRERPFSPWLRAAKGAKQWKENKWLVLACKGINSGSQSKHGNSEEGKRTCILEGGSSQKREGNSSKSADVWRIQKTTRRGRRWRLCMPGKNGEEASYKFVARQTQI
ncbi:unnamed protein product [Cuscuta europaea]|uniref:Zinc knuckle CX2CX4HX4C domain-containing protein n=1 Tax=Cuscuta europaea TaxID=41803 RepID=A0A9P0YT17_CUSEU|nr:unnamed protein product [Cuscuta europaea]